MNEEIISAFIFFKTLWYIDFFFLFVSADHTLDESNSNFFQHKVTFNVPRGIFLVFQAFLM
jgi:hypothetical protein